MTAIWVLCCDDVDPNEAFQAAFAKSLDPERAGRQLRMLGQARRSVQQVKAALISGAQRGEWPDVVLIDNWIDDEDADGAAAPHAVGLMHWIASTFPDRVPRCILMTGHYTSTLAHAFCVAGGAHAIDKTRGPTRKWPGRCAVIWDVLAGDRWQPSPRPPRVVFDDDELRLLPWLEAGRPSLETRRALNWTESVHSHNRRSIFRRLKANRLLTSAKITETHSVEMAEAARDGGAVWIPIQYQSLLGEGLPSSGAPR